MRYDYPDHDSMVRSLLEHYEASDGVTGHDWYDQGHAFAAGLGEVRIACGIVAALSPQVQWKVNKRLAEQVFSNDGEVTEGCLSLSGEKAWRIWNGEEPEDVLGTRKTLHFFRALMLDRDAPVVDTWMAQALGWPHNWFSPRQYERAAGALTAAAGYATLPTATFQAIVWTQVRGGED